MIHKGMPQNVPNIQKSVYAALYTELTENIHIKQNQAESNDLIQFHGILEKCLKKALSQEGLQTNVQVQKLARSIAAFLDHELVCGDGMEKIRKNLEILRGPRQYYVNVRSETLFQAKKEESRFPLVQPEEESDYLSCILLPTGKNLGPEEIHMPIQRDWINDEGHCLIRKEYLEEFFYERKTFHSDENEEFHLELQFFTVTRKKPVLAFRKSNGAAPFKAPNDLVRYYVNDNRIKSFYGPAILFRIPNLQSGKFSPKRKSLIEFSDFRMKEFDMQMIQNFSLSELKALNLKLNSIQTNENKLQVTKVRKQSLLYHQERIENRIMLVLNLIEIALQRGNFVFAEKNQEGTRDLNHCVASVGNFLNQQATLCAELTLNQNMWEVCRIGKWKEIISSPQSPFLFCEPPVTWIETYQFEQIVPENHVLDHSFLIQQPYFDKFSNSRLKRLIADGISVGISAKFASKDYNRIWIIESQKTQEGLLLSIPLSKENAMLFTFVIEKDSFYSQCTAMRIVNRNFQLTVDKCFEA